MKRIRKKLASSQGFTLAETLICVLILLMVTGIVAAAIPTASNVFMSAVDTANAQILESTAITVLRDELSTAKEIQPPIKSTGEVTLIYRSAETGRWSQIVSSHKVVTQEDGTNKDVYEIKLFEYGYKDATGYVFPDYEQPGVTDLTTGSVTYPASEGRYLVSSKATTENLSIWFEDATYENGVITITGLKVYRKGSSIPAAKRDSLVIKPVA